jgi:DNA-binding GntR family transcriptional regulator
VIKRVNTSDQVYEILRDRIVSLVLKPRDLLSRAELALSFGVSQTPVRDALLRLESIGLVRIFPQSRTEVAPIDPDQIEAVRFFRRGLELEAALTVAEQLTPVGLAALKEVHRALKAASRAETDRNVFMLVDKQFHKKLFELADQIDLHQLVEERSVHLDRLRLLQLPLAGKRKMIIAEHGAVIDAIESRNEAKIVASMRQHIKGTGKKILELQALYPNYF